ncbi:DNA polymerase III subunit beta [Thiomicrolovo sp. ZZH C-3]
MKTIINKSIFEQAVAKAASFTDAKDDSAKCVFISGKEGLLSIEATNFLESVKLIGIPYQSDELGGEIERMAVDGKRLQTIVKAFSDGDLELTREKDELTIRQGRSRFKMKIMEQNPLENINFPKGEKELKLNSQLIEGMGLIAHTIDPNTPSNAMGGVLLDVTTKAIAIVGTDGRRLAGVRYEHEAIENAQYIIPKGSMASIAKNFGGEISCSVDEVYLTIESDTMTYTTKLVNAKYPDWKRIFPKTAKMQATFRTADLLTLANQAAVISTDATVEVTGGEIVLTSEDDKGGSVQTATAVDSEIEGIKFSVNLKFLIDCLQMAEDTFDLLYNEANLPFVIKSGIMNEVIMPIASVDTKAEAA